MHELILLLSPTKREVLGASAVSGLLFVMFISSSGYIAPLFLETKSMADQQFTIHNPLASATTTTVLLDSVEVTTPREIRVSQSKEVTVRVIIEPYTYSVPGLTDGVADGGAVYSTDPVPSVLNAYQGSYDIDLASDVLRSVSIHPASKQEFEEPVETSASLTWAWSVSAKELGDWHIIIRGLPAHDIRFPRQSNAESDLDNDWDLEGIEWNMLESEDEQATPRVSTPEEQPEFVVASSFHNERVLRIPIRVLSASGLSAYQKDLMSVLSGLLAILGGILGLSIWKIFKKATQIEPTGPAPGGNSLIMPGDPKYKLPKQKNLRK